AELGHERRERIIADLGRGVRDLVDEGRLARVGQADESGIGKEFEPEPDAHLLPGHSRLVLARRAVGRSGIAGVAAAAHAALEQHNALANLGEVGEHMLALLVEDLRADRDLDHEVRGARARAVLAHAVAAALGAEVLRVTEVNQRVEAGDRLEHDVPALAAIAPVGPAELDELLAPEADRAGSAGARAQMYLGLVEEMHRRWLFAFGSNVLRQAQDERGLGLCPRLRSG